MSRREATRLGMVKQNGRVVGMTDLDAIVLAGGLGTRLGGAEKAALIGPDGLTSIELALGICWQAGAGKVVVVGPVEQTVAALDHLIADDVGPSPVDGVVGGQAYWRRVKAANGGRLIGFAQEDPPRSGPARAIAAGTACLARWPAADGTGCLVLACDMPRAGLAVSNLLDAWGFGDGVVAQSDGHTQWLLGLYRRDALERACLRLTKTNSEGGESARQLLGELNLVNVPVPDMATDDLDTPADLGRLGFTQSD